MGSAEYKILVLLKPGDVQPALDRAADFSRMLPGKIQVDVCRVVSDYNEKNKELLKTQTLRQIERLMEQHPAITNFASRVIFSHNVPRAFMAEADHGAYNLAIISANKRNTLKDLFVSTIDSTIMRNIRTPLLVVKNVLSQQTQSRAILIAIDFESNEHEDFLDEKLFAAAAAMAKEFNGEVHVANCVSPLNRGLRSRALNASYSSMSGTMPDRDEIHLKLLHEFADKHGISHDHTHILKGRIDEQIPLLCRSLAARMVCMGISSKSSILDSIDSTMSELVLEQIRGDLLIINVD